VSDIEETFEPATLGATPSSADAVDLRATAAKPTHSNWPMWALGLVIMIDQIDQNIVRGVVTPLKNEFHVSDTGIGVLLSCFILVNGLITVPAGYLADRWNRSRTIGHTVVAWSSITALTAAMPNFASLVAIRSALGFGQAITEPSAASLLADYYPAERRGTAFSIQQALFFVGIGLGIGIGGVIGAVWGWRAAFLVVGTPGVLIALAVYRLKEPRRGHGDRVHLGIEDGGDIEADVAPALFDQGIRQFFADMVEGLRKDLKTLFGIATMRYALIGVSALLFTFTAIGAALPQFYERNLGAAKGDAEVYVGLLIILGGVPGVLLGGRLADRYATRIRGARMAIPAYCLMIGNTIISLSYLHLSLAPTFALEVVGFFIMALSIPALRAGLSDAVPANLRGAGFGAFNLVSVVFGQAAASIIVFSLAQAFGDNLRTAFLIVSAPIFLGGIALLKARDHLDADAAKIFQAILTAMQEQQEREAEREAQKAQSRGTATDDDSPTAPTV
jgi:MFS family permease